MTNVAIGCKHTDLRPHVTLLSEVPWSERCRLGSTGFQPVYFGPPLTPMAEIHTDPLPFFGSGSF